MQYDGARKWKESTVFQSAINAALTLGSLERAAVLALILGLIACTRTDSVTSALNPSVLRIGVLPDQSRETLERRYGPLVAYIRDTLECETELIIPGSYEELVDAFDQGQLELAWFGGLTFTQAESRSEAEPLVLRDIDLEFTSDFLVSSSAGGRKLKDFSGRSLAFGPRLSTSGHLMPRYFWRKEGIDPEKFFSNVQYSSGHDQTANWVQERRVDLGVANSVVVESMLRDGRLDPDKVRILGRTPPYRNYVWAVPQDLDCTLRARLLDAFLALDRTVLEHERILNALGARAFLPASSAYYIELREASRMLGLSSRKAAR